MSKNEFALTLSISIISIIITIATTAIALYLIKHFMNQESKQSRPNSLNINENKKKTKKHNKKELSVAIKRYFKLSASITIFFNAFNAFFNTIYCVYLLLDPAHDDDAEAHFHDHPSHVQRITSTVSWYIAKVSLIWLFSGRLYHGFKGSALRINHH
eukprot:719653_1